MGNNDIPIQIDFLIHSKLNVYNYQRKSTKKNLWYIIIKRIYFALHSESNINKYKGIKYVHKRNTWQRQEILSKK